MTKVITYGSFDLFHEGHYKLLQRAKELGDYLIVGVTTEHYDESRGKLNVVDSLMTRVEHVRQTGFADEIIIEDHVGQKVEDILKYNVDVFTVGSDWIGKFDYLEQYCRVVYLERTKDISSTLLRAKNFNIMKIGIVGTGRIANRFISEVKYVSGINTGCVFNPNLEHAKSFSERHEIGNFTDNLNVFLDMVDAVYIASPHDTHYMYVKQALERGKHVLCEKPMVLEKKQAVELYELSEKNNCVLFEAIKTAYSPGFYQLLNVVRSGAIGTVHDVEACFTKLEKNNVRELNDKKYGGSFTELGSYGILPILKILGNKYKELRFEQIINENRIDIYTKAYFRYDNAVATCKVGLGVKSEGQLIISGTQGYIVVDAPWWKTQSFEVKHEDSSLNEKYFSKFQGDGLRYEISDFLSAINGNFAKINKLPFEESIKIAEIMEAFLLYRNNIKTEEQSWEK